MRIIFELEDRERQLLLAAKTESGAKEASKKKADKKSELYQKDPAYDFEKKMDCANSAFEKKEFYTALANLHAAMKDVQLTSCEWKQRNASKVFEMYYLSALSIYYKNNGVTAGGSKDYYDYLENAAKYARLLYLNDSVIAKKVLDVYTRLVEYIRPSKENRAIEYLIYSKKQAELEKIYATVPRTPSFERVDNAAKQQNNTYSQSREVVGENSSKDYAPAVFNNFWQSAMNAYEKKQYGTAQNLFRRVISFYEDLEMTEQRKNAEKAFDMYYTAALCNNEEGNRVDYKNNLEKVLKIDKRFFISSANHQKVLADVNRRLNSLSNESVKHSYSSVKQPKTSNPIAKQTAVEINSNNNVGNNQTNPGVQFYMPIEDTASITGRGTVFFGKIQKGSIRTNQSVEVYFSNGNTLKATVKSIEMYRRLIDYAKMGDNVGILLGGVDMESFINAVALRA